MESELFGAARGAFTGCVETREGIVSRANGGTLLLDELTELSVQAQGKLLRLLQEGTYRRVGDPTPRTVDVRFVAATNRPLADLLERRLLKPDLYHRLNGHRIRLRPLRERRHEIAMIAFQTARKIGLRGIEEDALALLEEAPWAGNVRELEMVLAAAGQASRPGDILKADVLRGRLQVPEPLAHNGSLRESRLAAERSALREALDAHSGNVSAASRSMGLSRQAFYKALKRTGGREPV
jgi:two-component system NtrC family response regulator